MKRFKALVGNASYIILLVYGAIKAFVELMELPEATERAIFERLPNTLSWLVTTPWWVAALLMAALLGVTCWGFWPDFSEAEELKKIRAALVESQEKCGRLSSKVDGLHNEVQFHPLALADIRTTFLAALNDRVQEVWEVVNSISETAHRAEAGLKSIDPNGDLFEVVRSLEARLAGLEAALIERIPHSK